MEIKPIVEIDGWILKSVYLTASGRKKVEEAYEWHFGGGCLRESGKEISSDEFWDRVEAGRVGEVSDWIFDIECDAINGLQHPVCRMNGEEILFEENKDYVIEMQSEEAFELEILAQKLNELHEVMQSEMKRLGW